MSDRDDLFGRRYQITVYKTNSPEDAENFKVEKSDDFDVLVITQAKIEFELERTLKHNPNQCSLRIYNLNESSRTTFKDDNLYLVFEAGYIGNMNVLFAGDVTYALSEHDGTEWVTHLEVADGDRMLASARISRSYRPGTTFRTVLSDAYSSVGQQLPDNVRSDPAFARTLPNGYSAFGDLRQFMTKILRPLGYSWSVQDGKIQVLSPEGTTNTVFTLSAANAMIGAPEFGQPPRTTKKGKKKHPTVTVKCLLYPQLRPGGIVELLSETISGSFKLLSVKHKGDYTGKDWVTEVEINPLSEVTERTNQLGGNASKRPQR